MEKAVWIAIFVVISQLPKIIFVPQIPSTSKAQATGAENFRSFPEPIPAQAF
jgi:hypothetical protein